MSGTEKEIDSLGRVVIPKAFRKKLGVESSSTVFVTLEGDSVVISPVSKRCVLCGNAKSESEIRICKACIAKIKSEY
ncbi:MAG: AbrB/MazE/SpoVT family DNA-binding domain-containing protein [Clostridia bacterium]|nr:AbrB/MazE/SpoVT family DNA-binding domain-containing protein [Clostridia bacterium]